MLYSLI
ncbi:8e1da2cb-f5d7-4c34-b8ad-1432ba64888b [Thermothielavioides terrestris]|nr:8e1da2cb-f5d7-4c34-b8ad-1432ba64888b [Thermothielavioides terrestris]